MSGGARVSSGIGGGLKKMIQDIREIAGQHTDEDIYAMLKECSMDPNETIQRLLHLDTFHEVKKKHGRRKENVEIRAFDNLGQQQGARVGRGAKVGRGNFHSQKDNGRRNVGGSKENGFTNISKGPKSENKAAPQSSRSVHLEVIGKNSQGGAPQENVGDINPAGHDLVPKILIPGETHLPADGSKTLSLTLTPASFASKQETILSNGNHVNSVEPCRQPSFSSETVNLGAVFSCSNSVHDDQHAILNGDATWSNDKIQIDGPISCMPKNVDTANSQLTDCNGNGEPPQADFAAKDVTYKEADNYVEEQFSSEEDTSVLNGDASTFNASDGHVVFPGHLQVPEAYKTKLTFGSFDCYWSVDGKQTSGGNGMNTDTQIDDPNLVKTVVQSSIESGVISTVKDAQEIEDPSHLQSPPPVSENTPLAEHPSSDVVIKIDESEAESRLRNGGHGLANPSSNYVFGYAPRGQLQTHDSTESQGGSLVASSTSSMDHISRTQPSGVEHDMASSPPPAPLLRQTYHPNFFPYGHYYPQFFVPQVQQYITHGGFPQHPSVANVYITPAAAAAAAAGIKYSHQQQKQGSNAGTDDYVGVPSGYGPYVPYAFPYGLPPVVVPGNVTVDDNHATQSKENTTAHMTDQQIESPGEWMAGTGRTISGMQVNPFYNLATGQGHPMVFPPTPAGFGGFGGVYHPAAAQTIPATQPTVHPYIHQTQAIGSAEAGAMPPAGFYQQQPQGAPIIWNNKQ